MLIHDYFELKTKPLMVGDISDINLDKLPFPIQLNSIPNNILKAIFNRAIGVEIEVEDASPMNVPSLFWTNTNDTSLRNNGVEFVSKYGMRLCHLFTALNSLLARVQKSRAEYGPNAYTFSERTSVHIHLDCRFFTEQEVENLLVLYTLVENLLFKMAGENRKHNVFCVPVRESTFHNADSLRLLLSVWDRYCAFNIMSLRDYGTIEFRHMEGNLDTERIFVWCVVLALLQDFASRTSTRAIKELIKDVKTVSEYSRVLEKIFFGFSGLLRWDERDMDRAASDAKLLFFNKE